MAERRLQADVGDDGELIERARRNDDDAIRAIIKQQNRRLYRIARSIVGDDGDAEDVLQESYILAFRELDTFRGDAQLGTWLARIVINVALGFRRRRKPIADLDGWRGRGLSKAEIIPFPSPNPDPEKSMAQREIVVLLEQAIDKLPEPFRVVLIARMVEGLSVEETASLFEILPQTVKTRLHRARVLLKQSMEAQIGPALIDAFPFAGKRCDRLTAAVLASLRANRP